MDSRRWQARMGACTVAAVALAVMAGCGSSSKSTGSSAGSSAQGQTVRGTISKGRGVSVALGDAMPGQTWLARAFDLIVETADAAVTGTPAVGVTVNLSCSGAPVLTTTTNSQGKFEFKGVTGGPCQLTAVVGGSPVTLLSDITPGTTPVEVEGVLNAASPPTTTGGVVAQKLEIEADCDDEQGHHHERHNGEIHGTNRGPGSVSSGPGSGKPSGHHGGNDDDQGEDS
jgi:hypothetical protein